LSLLRRFAKTMCVDVRELVEGAAMPTKWKLNPDEVAVDAGIGGGGGRGRHGRRQTVRCLTSYALRHFPTGITVAIEVHDMNLTRKQRLQLQAKLYQQLYPQLEARVAKHLRIPGR
jgi:hypothetical protein